MKVFVTGSNGLIGSAVTELLCQNGCRVVGIDNDGRKEYFGREASTMQVGRNLESKYPEFYRAYADITDRLLMENLFVKHKPDAIVHCAAQPSHDWAATNVMKDFEVNTVGTLNLLEAMRKHTPEAKFVFMSTNKVYGDRPNLIDVKEVNMRYEPVIEAYDKGINEQMPIDQSKHSPFGCSKLAADVYVQEYGRYFGLNTVVLRGGCLTGPAHAGVPLHGFLSYLFKCAVQKIPYTVVGYEGFQVRDNIHAKDVALLIDCLLRNDYRDGEVYNVGGGPDRSCSVLEAIEAAGVFVGKAMTLKFAKQARSGDHRWYVTDMSKFRKDFPMWDYTYSLEETYEEMFTSLVGSTV